MHSIGEMPLLTQGLDVLHNAAQYLIIRATSAKANPTQHEGQNDECVKRPEQQETRELFIFDSQINAQQIHCFCTKTAEIFRDVFISFFAERINLISVATYGTS